MMLEFEEKIRSIRKEDPRYARNAYLFAFEGLDFTLREKLNMTPEKMADMDEGERHISAEQLLEGLRDCAVDRYGYLARQVWESWGVYSTADWGNIIYNLINAQMMRASESDDINDFTGIFDFKTAFDDAWTWN